MARMAFNGQGEDVEYGLPDDQNDGSGFGGGFSQPQAGDEGKGGVYAGPGAGAIDNGLSDADNSDRQTGSETGRNGDPTSAGRGTSSTPRENFPGSGGNVRSTPSQGTQPRFAQGAVSNGSTGVQPFNPLPPIGSRGMASSRLFGSLGGLQGGGIGTPRGVSQIAGPEQSSISQLMAMLQKKRGLF